MANSLELNIVVDDNGSLKLVTKEAQAAGKALGGVSNNAQTTDRRLKGAAKASSNATKNFSKQAQGITSGLVPAYATLAANLFAAQAAFGFLRESADYLQLLQGQEALTMATGVAYQSLAKSLQAATDNQITFTEASRATAISLAAGLSGDQLKELGSAALTVSRTLGRDLTDSFNRLIRGVTKAEPELLDELGIILRLEDATREYARSLNVNRNDLTAYQRTQAVTNDVLRQVEERYGKINAIMDPVGNSMNKLAVSLEAVARQIGTALVGPANFIADVLTKNVFAAAASFGLFASSILSSVIPSVTDLAEENDFLNKRMQNLDRGIVGISETLDRNAKATEKLGTSMDILGLKVEKTKLRFQKAGIAIERFKVGALRAARALSRMAGVIGLAIVAWELLTAIFDAARKKLGLFNEEYEKLKETAEANSQALQSSADDFVKMGRRIEEVPFRTLREELEFIGNAANSISLQTLEDQIAVIRQLPQEVIKTNTKLRGRAGRGSGAGVVTTVAGLSQEAIDANQGLKEYLTTVGQVVPGVLELANSIDINKGVTDEQLGSLRQLVDTYAEQAARSAEIKELVQQETRARDALNNQFNATPIQTVLNLNEKLAKARAADLKVLASQLDSNDKYYEQKLKEYALAVRSLALARATALQFQALRDDEIALLDKQNALALKRLGLESQVTMAAQRQSALLREQETALSIEQKRLQIRAAMASVDIDDPLSVENAVRTVQALAREIALDQKRLEILKQQNNELIQMRDNAIQAFEGSLNTALQQLIKGQETNIKTLVLNIAEATLNSVADSLAKQFTTRISEFIFGKGDDPAEKIKNAMIDGANYFGSVAARAMGKTTPVSPTQSSLPPEATKAIGDLNTEGSGFSMKRYLFGAQGQVSVTEGNDTQTTSGRMGGVFGPFLNSLKGLFSGDAPFLKSLAGVFGNGLKGFGTLFSDLLGGIFGGGAGGIGGFIGGFFGLARGGVMPRGYASGGIVKEPTFLVGEGRHNEAVVPLPDGRSIPVSMPAGSAGVNNVTVNVSVDNNGNSQTQTQMDDQQTGQLGKFIANAVQEELQRQKRPGGILSPYGAA
jgi:hypothetical protein